MSKFYNIIINKEKFVKLLNDEKVYFSHKPLKHGNNIFTSQLIKLAIGETIQMDDYNYSAKLDGTIDDVEMLQYMLSSNLNPIWAIYHLYIHYKFDMNVDEFETKFIELLNKTI